MQKTIYVEGEKIVIKAKMSTSVGNFAGWRVNINGKKMFCNRLFMDEAIDSCFARWIKDEGATA